MVYAKVLVAYDGSKTANKALQHALELKRKNVAHKLEVVHCVPLPVFVMGEAIINVPESMEKKMIKESEEVLARLREQVKDEPDVQIVLKHGGAARCILEQAEEGAADLIIIGRRGLSGIGELLLGSVSHDIVQQATIPVMIIK